jgi:hypothetical protein
LHPSKQPNKSYTESKATLSTSSSIAADLLIGKFRSIRNTRTYDMMSGGRDIRTRVGLSNVRGEGAANTILSIGEVEVIIPGSVVTKSGVIDEGSQIDGSSLSGNIIS